MIPLRRIITALGIGVAMLNQTGDGLLVAQTQGGSSKTSENTMTIKAERRFNHTAETVYDAWVAEETIVAPVTRIEKDVRVGGHYQLFVEMENFTGVMNAEYLEIDPGRKLVYSWEWNDDGEETSVTVEFVPQNEGCLVRVTHGEFEKQESHERHAFGWENYFDGLAKQLSEKD